ncbi:MAG TPA: SAM-dependent chlorinase/fluorinase [Gemmatimonadaceae bacterium]|nr:SAM-dependent chlorinase/fluorinase [Gemmatimonadaceae bacterium]
MPAIITLLTDFGTADGYVAEMKGVLLAQAPGATLVDVSHDIDAHDVECGRLALARYWRRFPPGTIHLAVVDPGVGSSRAALAVASDGRMLVGPDNGVLSPALLAAGVEVVALPIPPTASPTFHGRDVFAPAAASLARGTAVSALGAPFEAPVVRRTPEPRRLADGSIEGQVITIDRFGNAITNCLGIRGGTIEIAGATLPIARTYAEAAPGALVALCGSAGLIEVAVRDGSAAAVLEISRGARVIYKPATEPVSARR